MTKDFLLKAAIQEFRDTSQKCLAIPFDRIITNEGYVYLQLNEDKAKDLVCAIHLEEEWSEENTSGVFTKARGIELSTREPLNPDTMMVYKEVRFFIKHYSGYNATMGQYMYICDALVADKMEFLQEPSEQLGYSSFALLREFDEGILPQFFAVDDFEDGRVFLEINATEQKSLVYDLDKKLNQLCDDTLTLTFINYTRNQMMTYIKKLCDYTIDSMSFGLSALPIVEEIHEDVDKASKIKGSSYKAEFRISYNIETTDNSEYKHIKKAFYKMSADDV